MEYLLVFLAGVATPFVCLFIVIILLLLSDRNISFV